MPSYIYTVTIEPWLFLLVYSIFETLQQGHSPYPSTHNIHICKQHKELEGTRGSIDGEEWFDQHQSKQT